MGAVKFYHLTNSSLEDAALMLLQGAFKQGWRVMLRGPQRAGLERLDQRLWTHPKGSFLPHGLEGGPHDAEQPLLLGQGPAVNGAKAMMLLAGCPVLPDEAQSMERVWLLFEDANEAQKQAARAEWKAVSAAGLDAEYWADASGRWEKKAESVAKR